jgi:hypothetical protein
VVFLLLNELKGYLKVTWNDEDETVFSPLILRGQAYLNEVAGVKLDYETDQVVKQLLLDYGRYVHNHSLEMFEVNFKRELLKLSIREGVKAHVAANT